MIYKWLLDGHASFPPRPRPLPRSPGQRPLASPGIEFAFTSDAKRVPRDVGVTFLLNCKLLLSMLLQLLNIFATIFECCLKLNIWLFLAKQGCLVWGHSFLQMIHQVKAIFERCLIIHLLGPHCSLFVSAVTFPRGTFTLCVKEGMPSVLSETLNCEDALLKKVLKLKKVLEFKKDWKYTDDL